MSLFNLTPSQLRRAAQVKEQIAELESELLKLSSTVVAKTVKLVKTARRKISAAGIEKIRAAQKARWAKIKGIKVTAPAKNAKRKMSASAKAKISAAAKARWAKIKAAKK